MLLWGYIPTSALNYGCYNDAAKPSYHNMLRPQFAAGADSLKIQKAAANIMHELSRTANRGGSPASCLDEWLSKRLIF
jgi:hypothetical protein